MFDLDLTIWETKNKDGNNIWAKQIIAPLQIVGKDTIQDDVYSICKLRGNFREFINSILMAGNKIGFISNSKYFNLPNEFQPVTLLLKKLELESTFNYEKILLYKTESKIPSLLNIVRKASLTNEQVLFFDDNEDILLEARKIQDLIVFDSKVIDNWYKYQ